MAAIAPRSDAGQGPLSRRHTRERNAGAATRWGGDENLAAQLYRLTHPRRPSAPVCVPGGSGLPQGRAVSRARLAPAALAGRAEFFGRHARGCAAAGAAAGAAGRCGGAGPRRPQHEQRAGDVQGERQVHIRVQGAPGPRRRHAAAAAAWLGRTAPVAGRATGRAATASAAAAEHAASRKPGWGAAGRRAPRFRPAPRASLRLPAAAADASASAPAVSSPLLQGKKQDYTYRLMTKVSAYNGGLVSPTGYYKVNVQGGQFTTFTYWWQARAHPALRTAPLAWRSPNARPFASCRCADAPLCSLLLCSSAAT